MWPDLSETALLGTDYWTATPFPNSLERKYSEKSAVDSGDDYGIPEYPNVCGNGVTGDTPPSVFLDCVRISMTLEMTDNNRLQMVMADEAVRISR